MRRDHIGARTCIYGTDPCAPHHCSDHVWDPSPSWHLNHHHVWLSLSTTPIYSTPFFRLQNEGSLTFSMTCSSPRYSYVRKVGSLTVCSVRSLCTLQPPIFLWCMLGSSVDLGAVAAYRTLCYGRIDNHSLAWHKNMARKGMHIVPLPSSFLPTTTETH